MNKIILKYGLLSGALCSLLMIATIPFSDRIGFDRAEYVGYTVMVLAFLLVFFGVRAYRESYGQGQITFVRAFAVGLAITLITCLFYVLTWEVMYFAFMPDFMDKYGAYLLDKARRSGASAAAIQAQTEQLKHYKQMYDNPLMNAAITLIEPLPVGLIVTLVSALVLRRRVRSEQPA